MTRILAALAACTLLAGPAVEAADLAKSRKNLPELVLGSTEGSPFEVSEKVIEMEAGKYYRLPITAEGSVEYRFFAPEFFRDIWLKEISINNIEIHMLGAPGHLEFDDPGTVYLLFVPIRTGEYRWYVEGLEDRGMTGTFVVR